MKEPSPQGLYAIAEELGSLQKFIEDLFTDEKALQEWTVNAESSEAVAIVWKGCDRGWLQAGSRTFLVKGLEFDHAVILNADELTINDLYVR